jgi:hypothetical protein
LKNPTKPLSPLKANLDRSENAVDVDIAVPLKEQT